MKPHRWRRWISVLLMIAALFFLPQQASASITQRFKASGDLVIGNLVSIKPATPDVVEAATLTNLSALYGVVTQIGTGSTAGTVQVADTEVATALVSISNGNINVGDPITASGLSGVGQKATTSTRIVGYAQSTFTAKSKDATSSDFKDQSGKTHKIIFGSIPVLLGAGNYVAPPSSSSSGNDLLNSGIPPAVQNFFNSIAGHEVVPNRIILSLFVLLVVAVIIGVISSTAVRRYLTAIGRNPLARKSLLRGLAQVLIIVLALVAGSMGGVYFIVTH